MTRGDADATMPAKWPIGPPAPKYVALLARACMVTTFALVCRWVHSSLGGVSTRPMALPDGSNDTSQLFNWHPIMMTLAFGVCMAEALMAYQAPLMASLSRAWRKKMHYSLHSAAVVFICLGLLAAFNSHNLKQPSPIPNLYSPHSFLGMTAVAAVSLQFLLGLGCYLYPGAPLHHRVALGPVHRFLGQGAWLMGLAAMATGIQEKTTFVQMGKKLAGDELYSAVVRLPAVTLVLLGLLPVFVLYHQAPPAKPHRPEEPPELFTPIMHHQQEDDEL